MKPLRRCPSLSLILGPALLLSLVLVSAPGSAGSAFCQTWGYDQQHTSNCLQSLAANQGGIAWWYAFDAGEILCPPAIDNSGRIICGGTHGLLVALEPSNGALDWYIRLPGEILAAPCIAQDGTIYVSAGPYLSALTPDGAVIWQLQFNSSLTAPSISPGGTIFVCQSGLVDWRGSAVYAVAPNGSVMWESSLRVTFCPSVAFGLDGTIYASFQNNPVVAFSPNGSVLWSARPIAQPGPVSVIANTGALTVGPDGTIYAGTNDGEFSAYRPNGTLEWSAHCQESMDGGVSIASDGTILAADRNASWHSGLYAFDGTGHLKWRYASNSPFIGAPVTTMDGLVLIWERAGPYGTLSMITALRMDGTVAWRLNWFNMMVEPDWYAPLSIGPDAKIYAPSIIDGHSCICQVGKGVPTAPMVGQAVGRHGHPFISWSAPSKDGGSPITGYKVYRAHMISYSNIVDNDGYQLVATLGSGARSFTDNEIGISQNGVFEYVYQVQASNSYGDGLIADFGNVDNSGMSSIDLGPYFVFPLAAIGIGAGAIAVLAWRDARRGKVR